METREKYIVELEIDGEIREIETYAPDRTTTGQALKYAETDKLKFFDILVKNCVCDEKEADEICNNTSLLLSVGSQISQMVKVYKGNFRKA